MLSHEEACTQEWSERYVVGDLSKEEQDEFEEHLFDCQDCSAHVRISYMLVRGVEATIKRDIKRPFEMNAGMQPEPAVMSPPRHQSKRGWLPASLTEALPFVAVILLSLTTGWEYFELENARAPQIVSAFTIHPQTKGALASQSFRLPGNGEFIELELDLLEVAAHYDWTLEFADSGVRLNQVVMSGQARPLANATVLKLLLPIRSLQAAPYRLTLRSDTGQQFLYSFEIK